MQVSARGGCLKNWCAENPLQIIYIEKLLQIKKRLSTFLTLSINIFFDQVLSINILGDIKKWVRS